MNLRAIVTAGGTTENIDDVRTVSVSQFLGAQASTEEDLQLTSSIAIANISGGDFGIHLAHALAERGVETTLLLRSQTARTLPNELPFRVLKFTTTQQLDELIRGEATALAPQFFFMAAAVSDYAPFDVTRGKISSELDEIVIRLRRNRKILPSLRQVMPKSIIVGFKLLSGVSVETLDCVAHKQILTCQTDYCVANDLRTIDWARGIHPIRIIRRDGSVTPLSGHRMDVAAALAERIIAESPWS